ncbi:uncharacterized protein N7458_002015 [Penicillium daleae]|uniref:Uncharacterized protein n=1 Tax=Penicillium daleae TaxID=63821 RepID=A0AAD6G6R0_9EURO|nr:uncharacterized protein N7458_002015 [Penicillium daleae]KAJ5460463.1 hypothetical protein N7458_002015 [Penicillium daleae]
MPSFYKPPPYELLPIKKAPRMPPSNDDYNPQSVIKHLLILAKATQTNTNESTFTQWRDQLSADLKSLVSHAHLLKPSNLVTLLQHGLVTPLEHVDGLRTKNTAICFPDRCQRIVKIASGLAECLNTELREKDTVFDDETCENIAWQGEMHGESGRLARERALTSASTLREEIEVYGIPKSRKDRNASFTIATDGVVTIHASLKVNMYMLAAAVGCLSLAGRDGTDQFADEVRSTVMDDFDQYLCSDDTYLLVFWSRFRPSAQIADRCGCLLCDDGI